jgi:hypothetical protein
VRHAASMDMMSLSLSRCSGPTSEGAPVWGIELGSGVRASEDYARTIRAAIRNVRMDGLPPFSGEYPSRPSAAVDGAEHAKKGLTLPRAPAPRLTDRAGLRARRLATRGT